MKIAVEIFSPCKIFEIWEVLANEKCLIAGLFFKCHINSLPKLFLLILQYFISLYIFLILLFTIEKLSGCSFFLVYPLYFDACFNSRTLAFLFIYRMVLLSNVSICMFSVSL